VEGGLPTSIRLLRIPESTILNTNSSIKDGATNLVPGQYRDADRIEEHRSIYEAVCQRGGTAKVWRDASRSGKLNRLGRIHGEGFGINIHRVGSRCMTERAGRYSAGCQVFQRAEDFAVIMEQARKSNWVCSALAGWPAHPLGRNAATVRGANSDTSPSTAHVILAQLALALGLFNDA
jgi:hypothetical protein